MFCIGKPTAPILVLCDPPSAEANRSQQVMTMDNLNYFAEVAENLGFKQSDFAFLNVCPYMDDATWNSESKKGEFLKQYKDEFLKTFSMTEPKLIITLGGVAARVIAGKSVKLTQGRGVFHKYKETHLPVIHLYSPSYVKRSPQNKPIFESDFRMVKQAVDKGYSTEGLGRVEGETLDYQWCTDLTEWINDKPKAISVDTEGTGLLWYKPEVFPFTVQLCREPGKAICIPVQPFYYSELERDHNKLMTQLKILLEDERIGKAGHNIKYDHHMIGKLNITMENWSVDTAQALCAVDENMKIKSLDEGVRRFVPALAGYADKFNATVDKSRMIEVPYDQLLTYACGDADSCFRLAKVLMTELRKDPKQYYIFQKIMMPGLRAFSNTLETNGVQIDTGALRELDSSLQEQVSSLENELLAMIPNKIKQKHIESFCEPYKNGEGYRKGKAPQDALNLGRDKLVKDILFSKDGFNLKPVVFTESKKEPSLSTKDHLPYFKENKFVDKYIQYQKTETILNTFIGKESDEKGNKTGFWQYIYNDKIHPSYNLLADTMRSKSEKPNGQNLPTRGRIAHEYKKVFVPPEGWSILGFDYSQAELRVVAWMAQERTMMKAYKDDLDLHALTAANSLDLSIDAFMQKGDDFVEEYRYKAKSENFGFVYGLMAKTFVSYAYTNYDLKITLEEAEFRRDKYFRLYSDLPAWHEAQVEYARKYKEVRAMHGGRRLLPHIDSTDFGVRSLAERQAKNGPIQGFASHLGMMTLIRLDRDLGRNKDIPIKPIRFVHDALYFLVRDDYVEEAIPYLKFYMESCPLEQWFDLKCPVPIVSDCELGKNLAKFLAEDDLKKGLKQNLLGMKKRKDIIAKAPDWYLGD